MRKHPFQPELKMHFPPPPQWKEINSVVLRFELKKNSNYNTAGHSISCLLFYSPKNEAMMKIACILRYSAAKLVPSLPCIQTRGTLMPQEEVALAENVKPAFKCRDEAALMWIGSTC